MTRWCHRSLFPRLSHVALFHLGRAARVRPRCIARSCRLLVRSRRARRADRAKRRRQVVVAQDRRDARRARRRFCHAPNELSTVYVPQEPEFDLDASVFDVVASGLTEARDARRIRRGRAFACWYARRPAARRLARAHERAANGARPARRVELAHVRRDHARPDRPRRQCALRRTLGRHEKRVALARAGRAAGHLAARRADQPSGLRRHPLARRIAGHVAHRPPVHHPRPGVSGSRAAAVLSGQFQRVPDAQGATARSRTGRAGQVRQATCAGRSVDSQGRGSAPHAQRRTHCAAGGNAQGTRRAAQREARRRAGREVRQDRWN